MNQYNNRPPMKPWKKDILISLLVGGIIVGALVLFFKVSGPAFGHSGPTNLSAIIVMFGFIPGLLLGNWLPHNQQQHWIESPFFHFATILAYAVFVWLLLRLYRWFSKLPHEDK